MTESASSSSSLRFSKEVVRANPTEDPNAKEVRHEIEEESRREGFENARRDAEMGGQEKGAEAAKDFLQGFRRGLGSRAGQAIWDLVKESLRD